jgi:spore coat polysaccharide biosynthesis protein SpsF
MNVVAVIQARMTSTRLPGKILQDIGGQPMLARVISRLRRSRLLNDVAVATSTRSEDEQTEALCSKLGVPCYRGSEDDVLDRFYLAAVDNEAEAVVRITADCPLIDPGVSDKVIQAFLDQQPDYASNTIERTYPRGLDTEVVTMQVLRSAWQEAREPFQRAHVTPFIYQHPERFRLLSVCGRADHSGLRWTVDTPADMDFVRAVYQRFGNRDDFEWLDVVALMEKEPALVEINRQVQQKPLREG